MRYRSINDSTYSVAVQLNGYYIATVSQFVSVSFNRFEKFEFISSTFCKLAFFSVFLIIFAASFPSRDCSQDRVKLKFCDSGKKARWAAIVPLLCLSQLLKRTLPSCPGLIVLIVLTYWFSLNESMLTMIVILMMMMMLSLIHI